MSSLTRKRRCTRYGTCWPPSCRGGYATTLDMVEQTGGVAGNHAPLLTVIAINMPPAVDESWAEALVQHRHARPTTPASTC